MSLTASPPSKAMQGGGRFDGIEHHDPTEPKVWSERSGRPGRHSPGVRFRSFEAGAKLLSSKNRILLRTIAERKPQSVTALAAMTGRTGQNVLRTLNKMVPAGLVRLNRGDGRARRPVLAVRKIHVEIDLLGE
jgi:predicted transcriptional regulator